MVINLIASQRLEELSRALNRALIVEEAVMAELRYDPRDNSDGGMLMRSLTSSGILQFTRLSDSQTEYFLNLVGAPTPDDLGDGEAATIAAAIGKGAAVIDERKARRIIARDFSNMPTYCTLDLLCSEPALDVLGSSGVANAVHSALRVGRMRVLPEWKEYVDGLLRLHNLERNGKVPGYKT